MLMIRRRYIITLITGLLLPLPLFGADLPKADATFPEPNMQEVRLGQLLFYDPILSGNRGVSCASCHHPRFGTADGLALGLGDGATGLGLERKIDVENAPEHRVPRNAPALFNLGAAQFSSLFYDGRLEADASRPSGLRTPLSEDMVGGFRSPLAAQAMFPVLSADEMAGHYSENDISQAVRLGRITGDDGAWQIIANRVANEPEYRAMFDPIIGVETQIKFADIANMIASFISFEWRADNSAFDQYLRAGTPLPKAAKRGMDLFYGAAGCADCHSGQFQTDHDFHAIAMPQIGPGKAAPFEDHARDTGRMRVTGNPDDAYRFRTPSLRNVTLTAPYGHAGNYSDLEGVVRHHFDPVAGLYAWTADNTTLPKLAGAQDFRVLEDQAELANIAAANELLPADIDDQGVADILAFLVALTDRPEEHPDRLGVPMALPAGRMPER